MTACVYPGGGHMMGWGYGYGGMFMFFIILLVLVGIVIYFIVNSKKLKQDYGEEDALDVLKKRYAKGEISRKEYESMKKDLEQ
ncbi:MAG: SHOCT domain-containing protein [candidate division WOR-3 bacterium]|nr:MAG: SHOCT domain-containing protein [candidate division WOR-3 bacterium]